MDCTLFVETTRYCPERCLHCGYSRRYSDDRTGIDHATLRRVLDLTGSWFRHRYAIWSGGEPAAADDFAELLAIFGASPVSRLMLATNGLPFIARPELFDLLREQPPDGVFISLDGTREEHDRLRARSGAYEGALAFLARLREELPSVRVEVNVLVHEANIDRPAELIGSLPPDGIDAVRMNRYRPLDRAEADALRGVSQERWGRFVREVIAPFNARRTGTGRVMLSVDRLGASPWPAHPNRLDLELRLPAELTIRHPPERKAEAGLFEADLDGIQCRSIVHEVVHPAETGRVEG
jgi:MoaA/NifB/PqqE/SkfB family radical SAM enzyme